MSSTESAQAPFDEYSSGTSGEEDTRRCKYVGKKAVVIGAGPAGATAAAFLAKNGFAVKVCIRSLDEDFELSRGLGLRRPKRSAETVLLFEARERNASVSEND